MIRLICLFFFIAACSNTKPTAFGPMKKNEGYEDKTLEDLKVVVFKGNSHTKKSTARLFAEFRAIEICRESGARIADIYDFQDMTTSKDIIRTNSFGPSYYYGMSPFYSRYSGFGLSAGLGNSQSSSWKETYVFPNIEVIFRCADTAMRTHLLLREVSAEEMKHLVKDLKGAIQIEKIMEQSPNKSIILPGDIILKVQGLRVQKVFEFLSHFTSSNGSRKVQVLRDGEKLEVTLKSTDSSEAVMKSEEQIIAKACEEKEIQTRPICRK